MPESRHAMTIRLDAPRYEWVRRMAYEHRIPMQKVIDEAIDLLRHTPAWTEALSDSREHGKRVKR